MFLRTVAAILLILFFFSCDTTSSNTTTANNFKVLDTIIDYTSVDMYPLFSNCQDFTEKKAQKECFENTLVERLSNSLNRIDYKVKLSINDSSYVNLLINNNGKAKVVSIDSPQIIQENIPQLDSIIKVSVDELPLLKPALKRGIPIKSQYKLAVVVRTKR